MCPYLTCLACAAALATSESAIAQPSSASVYTDISGKECAKHIDDELTGAYTMDCPGVLGFRLHVLVDDERSSVSVITPDKMVFPLNYWDVVTRGFSTLGSKAEWRITKVAGKAVPVALIVRVHALVQSETSPLGRTPFLAVAKIAVDGACVTGVVEASSRTANKQARQIAADRDKACLSAGSGTKSLKKG